MNKIVIAFDNQHFSKGAMEYLLMLQRVQPISVTGVFLPISEKLDLWSYAEGGLDHPVLMHQLTATETMIMEKNITTFEHMLKEDIPYRIHREFFDMALPELIRETRFADMMVIGNEVFYEEQGSDHMSEHLKDALFRSECPVMLVPEQFEFPGSNIIAYDGSESSVYAIKQFIYLFPEWCKNPTWLVYASKEGGELPDEGYIKELTSSHFPDITLSALPIHPQKYFNTWISEKKGALLVCGAFGRSVISENIRKSFVTEAINDHKLPVFTAHR